MRNTLRPDLYIALAGLTIAIALHWWNGVESDLPFGHHPTADDPSYLRPAENFADYGVWKDNTTGASSYIQRPPGMGMIHLPFYLLFGTYALVAETILFFLLHALALYHLPGIFRRFLSNTQGLFLSWIYALLPCFYGFLSYTITESITPSLAILLLAALFNEQRRSLATAIVLLFVLWMIRPILILLFPVFLYVLWTRRSELMRPKQRWNAVVLLLCLLLAGGWEIRKKVILGSEPYSMHPIYSATNQTPFRPLHAAFSNLFRIWETKPERFHALMGASWGNTSPTPQLVNDYCQSTDVPMPPRQLFVLLHDYWSANGTVETHPVRHQEPIGRETEQERALRIRVSRLADSIRKENRLRYHVLTPLKSATELLGKSQLNLELFQRHYRGTWWAEGLRFTCLLVILLITAGTFFTLFTGEKRLRWLAAGCILYLFYLCYVQRMNEDRYLIPALPLLFIAGGTWWTPIGQAILRRFRQNA